ncbi:ATP-binding protein [Plantactinospora sp. BB1]|uniref:ATP-binding protein n=1 Tax=Plantactinospora sp. BB1 TaxID=2071627 RepID=UPI001F2E3C82|nr:ATP-binding protein [Plantactinospora sp. BB1]
MDSMVQCETQLVGTRVVARFVGHLTVASAPSVRLNLLKCLADQPDALVVDLAALTVAQPTALTVFTAVARQAAVWPGTPVLLCAPDTTTSALLSSGSYGRMAVFDSIDRALSTDAGPLLPSVREMLLPVSSAARRARDVVTDACTRWHLADPVGPACLVATELVSNAVTHAQTLIDLRVSLRRYLMIAVQDGSVAEPRLSVAAPSTLGTGRGLLLVDRVARRWGSVPVEGGKVVWAALDIGSPPPE